MVLDLFRIVKRNSQKQDFEKDSLRTGGETVCLVYLDHLDWEKLKSFYVVAINESFTKASLQLNITQSAISRQIGIIEYQLKSQLFIRAPDKLFLTGKGEILFEAVINMIEEAKMAKSLIDEEDHQPKGKLTIATTNSFANVWLIDHLPNFLKNNLNFCLFMS